jgi:MarR family transcriptional regulator, transcriptional regulator for hemolysin
MERDVAQKMPLVTRAWRQLADAALAEFRVSNSMGWCLIWLDRLGPDARQTDLAQAIGISQPSTVRVVDQLEVAGLIERLRDPEDKRSNCLSLTERGSELVTKIEARLAELRHELFEGIDDAEIETTLNVINRLQDSIASRRS